MKKIMKMITVTCLIALTGLFLAGCKKKEKPKPEPEIKFPETEAFFQEGKKDESIFVSLDKDGSIKQIKAVVHLKDVHKDTYYVENGFFMPNGHANLTDALDLKVTTTEAKIPVLDDHKHFYYELALDHEKYTIPFAYEITYKHNNTKVTYEDVKGKSGNIEINIKITANETSGGYMTQLQIPFNENDVFIVDHKGASANVLVGRTRTLAYMVMPNANQEFTIKLDADTFTLEPIQITIQTFDMIGLLPMDLSMMSTMLTGLKEGTTAVKTQALEPLKNGLTELFNGHEGLVNGLSAFDLFESQIGELASLDNPEMHNHLKRPTTLTSSDPQVDEDVLKNYQTMMGAFNDIKLLGDEISTFLATTKPKLNVYKAQISSFDQAFLKLDSAIQNTTAIETLIQAMIDNMDMMDLEMMLKNKAMITLFTNNLTTAKNNLKNDLAYMMNHFYPYDNVMAGVVNDMISLIDYTIKLSEKLTNLKTTADIYGSHLRENILKYTLLEQPIIQACLAVLYGSPLMPDQDGLIDSLTKAIGQFDLEALNAEKQALSQLITPDTNGIRPIDQVLLGITKVYLGITIKDDEAEASYMEGLETLINLMGMIDLIPEINHEVKSFINPEGIKPQTVQFILSA